MALVRSSAERGKTAGDSIRTKPVNHTMLRMFMLSQAMSPCAKAVAYHLALLTATAAIQHVACAVGEMSPFVKEFRTKRA
jgi:hypothetical protein